MSGINVAAHGWVSMSTRLRREVSSRRSSRRRRFRAACRSLRLMLVAASSGDTARHMGHESFDESEVAAGDAGDGAGRISVVGDGRVEG